MKIGNGKKRKNQSGYEMGTDSLGRKAWIKTIEAASKDITEEIGMVQNDYLNVMQNAAAAKLANNEELYQELLEKSARIRSTLHEIGNFGMSLGEKGVDTKEWMDNYLKFKQYAGIDAEGRQSVSLKDRYENMDYSEEVFLDTVGGVQYLIGTKEDFEKTIKKYSDNYREKINSDEDPYEDRNWEDVEKTEVMPKVRTGAPISEEYYSKQQPNPRGEAIKGEKEPYFVDEGNYEEYEMGGNGRDYKSNSLIRSIENKTGLSQLGYTRMTRPIRFGPLWIFIGKDSFQKNFPWIIPSSISLDTGFGVRARLWSQRFEPAVVSSVDLPGGLSFRTTPKLKKRKQEGYQKEKFSSDEEFNDFIDESIDDRPSNQKGGIKTFADKMMRRLDNIAGTSTKRDPDGNKQYERNLENERRSRRKREKENIRRRKEQERQARKDARERSKRQRDKQEAKTAKEYEDILNNEYTARNM